MEALGTSNNGNTILSKFQTANLAVKISPIEGLMNLKMDGELYLK